MNNIHKGDIFRHFKNQFIMVDCVVRHTETNDSLVVYHHIDGTSNTTWARPISMWFDDKIDATGKTVKRFTKLNHIDNIPAVESLHGDICIKDIYVRDSDSTNILVYDILTDGNTNYILGIEGLDTNNSSNRIIILEENEMFRIMEGTNKPMFHKYMIEVKGIDDDV